jgi:flagellar biosynthesis protein FlhB
MENQNTGSSLFELTINDNLKNSLSGAAVWAGIVGVLSFINSILGLVQYFMLKNKTPRFQQFEGFETQTYSSDTGTNLFSAILSLVVSGLIFYFLNKFKSQTKAGLNGNSPDLVSSGLQGLSAYFILMGIITILILAAMVIIFAGAATGGTR